MKNKFVHYGFVLFMIAGICAGILGFTNSKTKPVIDANMQIRENTARIEVLAAATKFDTDNIIRLEVDNLEFIPGYDDSENLVGYVVRGSSNGYGGSIEFMLGIDPSGKITGLNILAHKETSNLGDKITGEAWRNSWIGRDATYEFRKNVDAFSGATVSPMAVHTGIKRVLEVFEREVKE